MLTTCTTTPSMAMEVSRMGLISFSVKAGSCKVTYILWPAVAIMKPRLGAHIRHVDHLHHNSQHGHEGEQDESWSGACGLWCMPVELLQGRHQAGGKGQPQGMKV